MPYLTAAVVLIGLIAVLNLGLTLALIRRLREADVDPSGPVAGPSRAAIDVGERPADFAAETIDGERLDAAALAGHLVGFFTPQCQPCHDRIVEFVDYARTTDAIAVLVGEPDEVAEYARMVTGVAKIVIEHPSGPMWTALGVRSVPAVVLLDGGGTVTASGVTFRTFPVPVSAR